MKFNKRKDKKESEIEKKRGTEKVNLNCDFLYTIDTTQLIKTVLWKNRNLKAF